MAGWTALGAASTLLIHTVVVKLGPIEVYVLECFREQKSARLPMAEIVGNSTAHRRGALTKAIRDLEVEHGMLRQRSHKHQIELTELGKEYVRMVSARDALPVFSGWNQS